MKSAAAPCLHAGPPWGELCAGGGVATAAAQDFKYTARRLGDKEQETGEGEVVPVKPQVS